MKTIALNGMYLTHKPTGIANFIIDAVNEIAKKCNIIVFANTEIHTTILPRMPKENVRYIIKYRKHTTTWFFIDFPRMLKKEKFDLLWNPAVWTPFFISKSSRKLVTVHDFVSRDFKKTMKPINRIVSNIIEKKSITKADYLWCNSNYTANKLEENYPKRKQQKIFIGDAPSECFTNLNILEEDKQFFLSSLGITKPFMLFVGSLEPRKNLSFLLKVFQEFRKQNDMQLVIVGGNKWGTSVIAKIINQPNYPKEDLIFPNYVLNEDLIKLYNLASCFVSTSLNEGFGMPQAEAMKCGCPVVTAHNSAMIEVVGDAGITVDGWDIEKWCSAIEKALEERIAIVEKQYERVKVYNWGEIIKCLIFYLEGADENTCKWL